eukprot:CAMPEP_0117665772 /NCGR_PEP_ID=MMETSP0804-20121206/9999_1 /TAXON_ID=1074897 /ORGANISM="Tetraselmis astigmatica, Strain CCMP880" /LENGTH=459 /DNA_ID=CAMNT_0005473229 /DNA_START=125 /DNA_END=1504 /DNA_ORIENTATION=+
MEGEPVAGTAHELVSEFVAATGCPEPQAQFFLEANANNLQRALTMYFEQMDVQRPVAPRPAAPSSRPRQPALASRGLWRSLFLRLPLGILRATFSLAFRSVGLGWSLISIIGHRLLPAAVVRAIKRSADAALCSGDIVDPQSAATRFIEAFHDAYGESCPAWQASSWQEAAGRAHREFKFLMVYLHSSEHQDTPSFCQNILCNTAFVEYVNENFVVWGGDVCYSDAFGLAQSIKATTFPSVALLLGSSSRLRLVCLLEGRSYNAETLMARLLSAVDDHGAQLVVDRTEAQEREMNRMLREQQDREYQESLEQDRLREEAVEAERRAAEEAVRAAEEEEARIRAGEEAEARRQRDFQAAIAKRRAKAYAAVTEEPPAGTPGSCPVRVRMPDGSNLQRRFLTTDKVQALYDYVDIQEGFEILKYNLVSNFPHCVYEGEKRGLTLAEAGLAGAMLLIQSLDD